MPSSAQAHAANGGTSELPSLTLRAVQGSEIHASTRSPAATTRMAMPARCHSTRRRATLVAMDPS